MSGFSPVITILYPDEKEYAELVEKYGNRIGLQAMWSWNGELVSVDNFTEIDKMNDNEDYAHTKLMNANCRL